MLSLLRQLMILTLIAATAEAAQAQIVLPSDVGVSLTASPVTNLQPDQPIDMTLTVTNYGPADVPTLLLDSSIYADELNVVSTNPSECYLVLLVIDLSNGTSEYQLQWWPAGLGAFPPLEAGTTITCHFQIALTQRAPSPYSFSFGLHSNFETDSNPTNDRATVTLQRAPAAPPAPVPGLSTTMLGLLAALSAGCAAQTLRRRSSSAPS